MIVALQILAIWSCLGIVAHVAYALFLPRREDDE